MALAESVPAIGQITPVHRTPARWTTIHLGMLENAACEQASRVQAMENSSSNASDMLDALTTKYNKTRQAGITTELIEIISGAVALEG